MEEVDTDMVVVDSKVGRQVDKGCRVQVDMGCKKVVVAQQ